MNLILLFLGLFLGFFVIVLPTIFMFIYLKSFNKKAIILSEVGQDADDAIPRIVKIKIVRDKEVGGIIKFFPGTGFQPCKQFDSGEWTTIKYKNKLIEGIILYRQGDNFRPIRLEKNDDLKLLVKDEDNRRFRMQYEIMRVKKSGDMSVFTTTIIAFFIFLFFSLTVGLFVMLAIMDNSTRQYFLYQGATVITG